MKLLRLHVWIAAMGFVAASAGMSQAALMIDNAGFEAPEVTSSNGVFGDAPTDWTGSGGTIQTMENGGTAGLNSNGLTAPEGDQAIRLIESGSDGQSVILSQDIGTITQSEIDNLLLRFDIGRETGAEIPVSSVGLVFRDGNNDVIGGSFVNGLAAPAAGTFETRTFSLADFVNDVGGAGAGSSVELRFIAREGNFAGAADGDPGISGSEGSSDRHCSSAPAR